MVRGAEAGAWLFVDLAGFEARGEAGREEEVVDADAAVVLERLAEEVPISEEAALARMKGAEGVDVAEVEQGAITGTGLGLEEGVARPGGGLVAVDVLGDDVEVAADDGRDRVVAPKGELADEAVHPIELVGELVRADGVAVGEIDVDDAEAVCPTSNEDFKEAGVAVGLVAEEGGADGLDGVARKDGDAVVGLLGDGGALVADGGEDVGREVGAFELLEEEEVGLARAEPGGDVVEAGADGIDVPGGDLDGGAP